MIAICKSYNGRISISAIHYPYNFAIFSFITIQLIITDDFNELLHIKE